MQEEDPLATNLQIGQQLFKYQKQLFKTGNDTSELAHMHKLFNIKRIIHK